MPSSEIEEPTVSEIERRIALAAAQRISQACWDLLNYFRRHNWQAHALDLIDVNPLNYRARISELRQNFGIIIEPNPPHPPRGTAALYKIPPESWPRAEYLLVHLSLEGFQSAPFQKGLFT